MKISLIVPLLSQNEVSAEFLQKCEDKLASLTEEFEIILPLTTLELSNKLNFSNLKTIILNAEDDYQQQIIACIDNASFETIIILSDIYPVEKIEEMLKYHKDGAEIVCYEPKLTKTQHFFAKIGQGFYNFVLKIFGKGLFSIGILKDIQLLSGEVIEVMQNNQTFAHRIRTMYAPLEYETEFLPLDYAEIKQKSNSQILVPKANATFYVSSIISLLLFVVLITGFIIAGIKSPNILTFFLIFIGFAFLEFISVSIAVNSIAKTKIGVLYEPDKNGKIYHLQNEKQ